jgi:hypothetical protein
MAVWSPCVGCVCRALCVVAGMSDWVAVFVFENGVRSARDQLLPTRAAHGLLHCCAACRVCLLVRSCMVAGGVGGWGGGGCVFVHERVFPRPLPVCRFFSVTRPSLRPGA